ncbi:hypothetical protein MAR_021857, partial [Mya arenaria]
LLTGSQSVCIREKSELVLRTKGVQKSALIDRNEVQINAEVNLRQCDKLVTPLGEKLPHPKTLISWTSDLMNIPYFSDSDIYNYFVLKMNTKKQLRSKVDYADRHMYSIMYSSIDEKLCHHCQVPLPKTIQDTMFSSACQTSLVRYILQIVVVQLDERGEAYNHIVAIMYALLDISTKKKDGTIASTSNKCVWDQFNNPRKRKFTPKKSIELKFRKFKVDTEEPSKPKKQIAKELFNISFSEHNFPKKCRHVIHLLAGFLTLNVTKGLKLSKDHSEGVEKITRGQGKIIIG